MDGVLVVDKPSGPTSFDVVQRVRKALEGKKAGHTGTLDPLATGVLPICLGEATKIAGFITEASKAYDAVVALGRETDTLDADGKTVSEAAVPPLTRELLEAALQPFRGAFLQIPPMYSAIKVGGKRLYELARAGEEIERAPRKVTVTSLLLRDFSALEVQLSVACSKGFFVRVLAQDLGRALGCGAHLKALRRTRSGPFTLEQAVPLDQVGGASLVSMSDALAELPALTVTAAEAVKVSHGVPLEVSVAGLHRILGPDGALLAVAEADQGKLKYRRVIR